MFPFAASGDSCFAMSSSALASLPSYAVPIRFYLIDVVPGLRSKAVEAKGLWLPLCLKDGFHELCLIAPLIDVMEHLDFESHEFRFPVGGCTPLAGLVTSVA